MAEHLFLRPGGSLEQVAFLAMNAEGQLLGHAGSGPLAAAGAKALGMPVTVLLPASEIVSAVAALPAASSSRLRQMLPYSLEDEFAGDVEDLHFALGERNDSGQHPVSVIERKRFDHWLAALAAAGIVPRRICSEADGIPDTPGVTTLLLEGQKTFGRRPGSAPFAFEEIGLSELWTLLRAEREDGADLNEVILYADRATLQQRGAEIDAWRSGLTNLDIKELGDGSLPRLAATLAFREAPNLLQGSYAPKSNYVALIRPWRAAAALALAVVGIAVAGKAAEAWKLGQDDASLRAEIDAICAASYGASSENRCLAELQRRLGQARQGTGAGSGALATLAAVASAGGDAFRLAAADFNGEVLTLDVVAPDAQFLERFGDRIAASGMYDVRPGRSSPEGEQIKARLTIVGARP